MAGFNEGIKVFFGGDTSKLRSSLSEANGLVDQFSKTVKKAGIDLGKGFGLGVLIFQAKQFFDAVINDAQKTRDAFEEMGKPVPTAIASVARLGDEVDRLKKGALEVGTTMLSWVTKAGEGWGMLINRIRGVTTEQEKLYEQIERNADKEDKDREEAFKNRASKEKARADESRRNAEAAAKAREKKLDDEYEKIERVGKAEKDLAEKKKDFTHQQLSLQDKVKAGEKDVADLSLKIAEYKQHQNLSSNDQLRVLDLETQKLEAEKKLYEDRKDLAEKTKLTEEQIARNLERQKNSLASIVGIRGGNQFNQASDESLAEVARRNRNAAAAARGGRGGFGLGQDLEAARLESEAVNAEKELQFRRRIRLDASLGGKELARSNFAGDPLEFERLFAQIVKGQSVQEQNLEVNKALFELLKYRGILTVPQGK